MSKHDLRRAPEGILDLGHRVGMSHEVNDFFPRSLGVDSHPIGNIACRFSFTADPGLSNLREPLRGFALLFGSRFEAL